MPHVSSTRTMRTRARRVWRALLALAATTREHQGACNTVALVLMFSGFVVRAAWLLPLRFLAVCFLIHWVGLTLIAPLRLPLPPRWSALLKTLLWTSLGAIAVLVGGVVLRFLRVGVLTDPDTRLTSNMAFFSALGLLMFLLLAAAIKAGALKAADALRPLFKKHPQAFSPERRALLDNVLSGSLLAGATAVAAHGHDVVRRGPIVRTVTLPVEGLHPDLEGFRFVQISDTHIGETLGSAFSEALVAACNALAPDAVCITGDLVEATVGMAFDMVAPLGGLRASHGVWYVTGNHEYYWGAHAWTERLRTLGWNVLINESKSIAVGAARIQMAGVTDKHTRRDPDAYDVCDPARALALASDERPDFRVLLCHQPSLIHEARQNGADLMLSGHTHGGQIFPGNLIVWLTQPIVRGLAKFGNTFLYVNEGTGYWGMPSRVGTVSEITLMVLKRTHPAAPEISKGAGEAAG